MTAAVPYRAAVLGSPIGHTLSPVLHRAAYDVLGLTDWTYEAYDVTAGGLADFLAGLDDEWAGLSLTMPLKAAVLPMLDGASPLVEAVGAANTVLLGHGRRLGENTDVPGMVAALHEHGVDDVASVAVLGGGATARSAVAAAAAVAPFVTAFVRTPARSQALQHTANIVGVELEVRRWSDVAAAFGAPLVINTTPVGAADRWVGTVPRSVGALFEVLYDPWPTTLAAAWTARGGLVVDGLDLLVHQALPQVALMTGAEVADPGLAATLRRAGVRALRSG